MKLHRPHSSVAIPSSSIWTRLGSVALAASLAACGGGAAGSGGATSASTSTLSLHGVAASGRALAATTVQAVCANAASGTATSGIDGHYTLSVAGAVAPCLLHATDSANGLELYSAYAAGMNASNLTPLSTLIVDHALGADAGQLYGGFGSNAAAQQALSAAALGSSQSAITQALGSALGWQAPAGVDLLQGDFVAASVVARGDATDQQLDALAAQLAPLSASAPTAFAPLAAAATAPSPNLALAGAAAGTSPTCPFALSGNYWMATAGDSAMQELALNFGSNAITSAISGTPASVAPMSVLTASGASYTLQPDGSHACGFLVAPAGASTPGGALYITRDGVGLFSSFGASAPSLPLAAGTTYPTKSASVLLPAQGVTPAALAGSWDLVGYASDGYLPGSATSSTPWASDAGLLTLATDGSGSYGSCNGASPPSGSQQAQPCPSTTNPPAPWASWTLAASSASASGDPGLFTLTTNPAAGSANTNPTRQYTVAAYVAPDGNRVMVGLPSAPTSFNGLFVAVRHATRFAMRTVGTAVDGIDLYINSTPVAGSSPTSYTLGFAIEDLPTQTLAVHALGDTMVSVDRSFQENGAPLHLDTVWYDLPDAGMLYRPPLAAATSPSITTGATEFVALSGLGWTAADLTGIGADGSRANNGALILTFKP